MKKKIYSIVLIAVLLLTTGCGSSNYITKDDKIVTYEKTGQSLQKDILCKPVEEDLLNMYKENEDQLKHPIDELVSCKDFKINSGDYEGLWDTIFVKPLAWVILKIGYLIKNFGVAVMLVGIAIRLILLPFTKKTMMQSENMKKAQPELKKIEKKYANKTDNDSIMMKSQEMMMVYKKYSISPVSGCLISFIQLPLFFAFLQAINRVPAIFEDSLFGMSLGMTPWKGISNGQYIYIVLILLIIFTTYFSFKYSMKGNSMGNNEMEKQMQFTLNFMIVMIAVASFSLPTAIAFYWVVTNGFIVLQNYIVKKWMIKDQKKENKKGDKKRG